MLRALLLSVTCSLLILGGPSTAAAQDPATLQACLARNASTPKAQAIVCKDAELRRWDATLYTWLTGLELPSHKQASVTKLLTMWIMEREQQKDTKAMKEFYRTTAPIWLEEVERIEKEEIA